MGVENKFIIGVPFPWLSEEAYEDAVLDGIIDPSQVTLRDFYQMIEEKVMFDIQDDRPSEHVASERSVANLFRNAQSRRRVIETWFGK